MVDLHGPVGEVREILQRRPIFSIIEPSAQKFRATHGRACGHAVTSLIGLRAPGR